MSSEDIQKGARGLAVIADQLKETDYGLVIVTKTNQLAPWLNFEAGAVGKLLGQSRVAPLLLDLTQSDITGPLEQFQMTSLESRDDVLRLLKDMLESAETTIPFESVSKLFEQMWPDLEATIMSAAPETKKDLKTSREVPDLLEEILLRVRKLERDLTGRPPLRADRDSARTFSSQATLATSQLFAALGEPMGVPIGSDWTVDDRGREWGRVSAILSKSDRARLNDIGPRLMDLAIKLGMVVRLELPNGEEQYMPPGYYLAGEDNDPEFDTPETYQGQ